MYVPARIAKHVCPSRTLTTTALQIQRTLATMPPITKQEAEGEEYDLFVIGGGSGGLACAVRPVTNPSRWLPISGRG